MELRNLIFLFVYDGRDFSMLKCWCEGNESSSSNMNVTNMFIKYSFIYFVLY